MPLRTSMVQLLALCLLISRLGLANPGDDPDAKWHMEHQLATTALASGDYAAAEMHEIQATKVAEGIGENDVRLENSLTELGNLYQAQGKLAQSQAALEKALAIREALFANDSLEVAFARNNLSAIYQQNGQLQKAAALQTQALDVARRILPASDPRLIPYLSDSGTLQRMLKNYKAAEAFLTQALEICESNHKGARIESSLLLHLGAIHVAEEHYAQAETFFRKALALYDTNAGMERVRQIDVLNSLGDLLASQGNFEGAMPIFQRALAVCRDMHVSNRPCIAALSNMGSAELSLGNIAKAEEDTHQALIAIESAAGNKYTMTALAMNNLGKTYLVQHRFKEATGLFEQARDIWKATLGPNSPEYAATLGNIAAVHATRGKFGKAEQLDREALALNAATLGPEHSKTVESMNHLASDLSGEKRYDEAERLLRRCIEINAKLSTPVLGLASVLHAQDRADEAVDLYRKGFQMAAQSGVRQTPWMAGMLEDYSVLLRQRKEYAEAEQAATQAMGIRVKHALHPNGFQAAE